MGNIEDFKLPSTESQLRRAAEHAFGFYRGAIPLPQCQRAGRTPGPGIRPTATQVLTDLQIEIGVAFAKPLTDDALLAADVIVVLGDVEPLVRLDTDPPARLGQGRRQILHWPMEQVDDSSYHDLSRLRDDLDRRVLRLLADLLNPANTG